MIIYSRTISKLRVSSYMIFCRDFEKTKNVLIPTSVVQYIMLCNMERLNCRTFSESYYIS